MLTRPDPPKSGKIVTRPDPTRGSIRPVDNSGMDDHWPWFVAQWCVVLQPKNRYRMTPGARHSCIVNVVHWIELHHLWYFSLSPFSLPIDPDVPISLHTFDPTEPISHIHRSDGAQFTPPPPDLIELISPPHWSHAPCSLPISWIPWPMLPLPIYLMESINIGKLLEGLRMWVPVYVPLVRDPTCI